MKKVYNLSARIQMADQIQIADQIQMADISSVILKDFLKKVRFKKKV